MPNSIARAPEPADSQWRTLIPLLVVLFAVSLNVASGIVLKSLANRSHFSYAIITVGIALVVLINGLRFATWTFAHKRYPISTTYPLTSLFYPVMLAVAYFYNEPIGPNQWIGAGLITTGVVLLSWRVVR